MNAPDKPVKNIRKAPFGAHLFAPQLGQSCVGSPGVRASSGFRLHVDKGSHRRFLAIRVTFRASARLLRAFELQA